MFDRETMIQDLLSQEDRCEIENNISIITNNFESAVEAICSYVKKMKLEGQDWDVIAILMNSIADLQISLRNNIMRSFKLIGDPTDELKAARLDFYRRVLADAAEITFHAVVIINFYIGKVEDCEEIEDVKKSVDTAITMAVKICAVHGLNLKETLLYFINLKNASFMSYKNAMLSLSVAAKTLDPSKLFELRLEKVSDDEFTIKVGELVDKEEKLVIMRPYNPYGGDDEELIKLVPIKTMFIDSERHIRKGFIPDTNSNFAHSETIH